MSKPHIASCPHCHSLDHRIAEYVVYRIICGSCGTHTRKGDMSEITILWNENKTSEDNFDV